MTLFSAEPVPTRASEAQVRCWPVSRNDPDESLLAVRQTEEEGAVLRGLPRVGLDEPLSTSISQFWQQA